jgi:hypothetical protein
MLGAPTHGLIRPPHNAVPGFKSFFTGPAQGTVPMNLRAHVEALEKAADASLASQRRRELDEAHRRSQAFARDRVEVVAACLQGEPPPPPPDLDLDNTLLALDPDERRRPRGGDTSPDRTHRRTEEVMAATARRRTPSQRCEATRVGSSGDGPCETTRGVASASDRSTTQT